MRKILLLCGLLAMMATAAAQGTYEIPVGSHNSVVRVYGDDQMIVYNRKTGGVGQFLSVKYGQTSVKVFDLPDTAMDVMDFEIMGDTVWFCGVYKDAAMTGGTAGVVGMFDIAGAFAGIERVHYIILTNWITFNFLNPEEALYVRNLSRLDVFRDPEMGTVAAMIGDVYLYQSALLQRVAALSAFVFPSSNNWQVVSSFPKDGRMVLTDIACLDDMIVTVGHGLSNTHCITKTYHRSNGFPMFPFNVYMYDSIYCANADPEGIVLATHVEGNVVGLTQLDKEPGTLLHVLEFSNTTGHPMMYTPSRQTFSAGCDIVSCPWKLEELRYSRTNNTLHVLERGVLPGDPTFGTLLWKFPLVYNGETTAEVQQMTDLTQTSMDVDVNNHPVMSGSVDASGLLDMQTFVPGGIFHALDGTTQYGDETGYEYDKCTNNTEVEIEETHLDFHVMGADDPCCECSFIGETFLPVVYTVESNIICE